MSFAVRLGDHETRILELAFALAAHGEGAKGVGVVAARARPLGVDAAAFFGDELTCRTPFVRL